jgi:hypothetical protein
MRGRIVASLAVIAACGAPPGPEGTWVLTKKTFGTVVAKEAGFSFDDGSDPAEAMIRIELEAGGKATFVVSGYGRGDEANVGTWRAEGQKIVLDAPGLDPPPGLFYRDGELQLEQSGFVFPLERR